MCGTHCSSRMFSENFPLSSALQHTSHSLPQTCSSTCRRKALPLQSVRSLLHAEGEPPAPHQAALRREALQMPLLQLCLPPARRSHWPPPYTLRSVTTQEEQREWHPTCSEKSFKMSLHWRGTVSVPEEWEHPQGAPTGSTYRARTEQIGTCLADL